MALALWLVGGFVFVVFFGTWAIQIAAWIIVVALRLIGLVATLMFGLAATLALAVWDRPALGRIWNNQRVQADNDALLGRERRGQAG